MPASILDFDRETVFVSLLISNLSTALTGGLRSPAQTALDPTWEDLQREEHLTALHACRLELPGRPQAASFVHATLAAATPWGLHIATGHAGVRLRQNRDLVHVQTSPSSLDREGVPYLRVDRSPLANGVRFSLHRTLAIDRDLLRSRDFRSGRNPEFGAGLLIQAAIPPTAIERLVCADEAARQAVATTVRAAGLAIPVVADPTAFFWPAQQARPREPHRSS